ncbi:hypothetical protein MRX96_006000 [Rhipicephalus microplus]
MRSAKHPPCHLKPITTAAPYGRPGCSRMDKEPRWKVKSSCLAERGASVASLISLREPRPSDGREGSRRTPNDLHAFAPAGDAGQNEHRRRTKEGYCTLPLMSIEKVTALRAREACGCS